MTMRKRIFLEARRERVLESNRKAFRWEGLKSFFPGSYWPGFDASRIPSDIRSGKYDAKQQTDEDFVCLDPMATGIFRTWDSVFTVPYCQGARVPIYDRKSLPPYRQLNSDWDTIAMDLNRVGRPSGDGEFLRPEGRWIVDLVKDPDGTKLLESAHAVHHLRQLVGASEGFLECLAELAFAKRYGVAFWCPDASDVEHGDRDGDGFFARIGMRFAVSTNMRKPWLTVPAVGPDAPRPYQDSCVVLCGIHLEPQPWSAREDNPNDDDESWLEMNRWSCMPTIVTFCGWMFVDELMKLPLVGRYRSSKPEEVCVTAPAIALDGPSTIDDYMSELSEEYRTSRPGVGLWTFDDFVRERLPVVERIIPPFPCKDCLRLNMASEGAPTRPMHARPDKREKGARKTDAELEWEAYDAKVDKIVRTVEKACDFHDRRFKYKEKGRKERKSRRSNWRKIVGLLEKARSARKRADRFLQQFELSKMEAENNKARSFYSEIAAMMKGKTNEN